MRSKNRDWFRAPWRPALWRPALSCAALILVAVISFAQLGLANETAASAEPTASEEVAAEPASAPPAADEEAKPAEPPPPPTTSELEGRLNTLWTLVAAVLVFFMQAGFACVETGFTRAKNACNIMMKNLMDFCIGSVAFWLVGFCLMFGATSAVNGWLGIDNFMFDAASPSVSDGGYMKNDTTESFGWAFLLFQTVFCATAATIVSGAMAERTKFTAYLIYSAAISLFIYPIFGAWAWGNLWVGEGWLAAKHGFVDFAGSTVVHSIGGWCALAGAIAVGPRIGKYKDGKIMPIPGHNIPLAALGVFILWLGWFGFNPGSTNVVNSATDAAAATGASFAKIAITTNIAACTGALGAMFTAWLVFKKPDTSFVLNGALAGLVAITAGCASMQVHYAALTGLLAGILVVGSCIFFERIGIDDPVGAISVHGVCGAFGTLAVGLFGTASFTTQLLGVSLAFAWAFPVCLGLFYLIKVTVGLRVSAQEEIEGLDIHEHGMTAYPPVLVADPLVAGTPLTPPAWMPGGTLAPSPAARPAMEGAS